MALIITSNLITIFNYSQTGVVTFPDMYMRINPNENSINQYFFFWTSLTYLPSFFSLLTLLVFNQSTNGLKGGYVNTLTLILVLYNIELVDFQIASTISEVFDTTQTSFNFLLTNNLNKYHPFIFYVSAILTLTLFTRLSVPHQSWSIFTQIASIKISRQITQSVIWINLFALYLGSWWALQEGTWGGWWNWDASEVFGLLFALFSLRLVHTSTPLNTYKELYVWLRLVMYTLILTYFFIQLNFDLVSHNFGAKFFFFFSNNLFFIEVLLIATTSISLLGRSLLTSNNQWLLTSHTVRTRVSWKMLSRSPVFWLVPALYFLLSLLMVNSFLPLLNYFWWNFFQINLFNSEIYSCSILLLIIFFLIWLTPTSNTSSTLALSFMYWESPLSILVATWNREIGALAYLHFLLTAFFILNICSHDTSFIYFYTLDTTEALLFDKRLFYPLQPLLTCDNFEIALALNYLTPVDGAIISNYNLIYHANIPLVNSFTLLANQETTLNLYHLSWSSLAVILYIESPLLILLNNVILLSLPLFYLIVNPSSTR